MKLILFGTGPFAVPSFQALLDSSHDVLALVTRPIADPGKRRKSSENPTRDLAEARGLPIHDPASANATEFVETLRNLHADLFVVCDFGQILSRACLAAAKLGGINLHGSLLPKYRGAAPIHWAILQGETETGVTIIHMTPKLDGGPCLAAAKLLIATTATTEEIEPQLAQLGVRAVQQAIELLTTWDGVTPIGTRQDPALATAAPRLQKSDGEIIWTRSAVQLSNQIRAFQPWPGSFTEWAAPQTKIPMRLIIHRASVATDNDSHLGTENSIGALTSIGFSAGQVSGLEKNRLLIQTGDGNLSIEEIQPAGKRRMSIEEFLRGQSIELGSRFGNFDGRDISKLWR